MNDLENKVFEIANQAQASTTAHAKCLQQMKRLFEANELSDFWEPFTKYISLILRQDYTVTNIYSERSIDFIAAFCTSMEKKNADSDETLMESPFLANIIEFLLEKLRSVNPNLRFRSCQTINKILERMVGAELSVELVDNMQDLILERSRDVKTAIRLQAVAALQSFQDPENLDCPVIGEYVTRMHNDTNATVRKMCIERIAPRKDIIPNVLLRTRDMNLKVRLAAFSRAWKSPQYFGIENKQIVIKNGFQDDSEIVKKFMIEHLVPAWLEYYDNDYLRFLKALVLDANEKDLIETTTVIKHVLNALFHVKQHEEILGVIKLNEDKLLNFEDLKYESVLYWYFLNEHLKQIDSHDELTADFISFCDYIKRYCILKNETHLSNVDFIEYTFVLNRLLLIAIGYDFSDSRCRKSFNVLISEIIKNYTLDETVISTAIGNLDFTLPNINEKIRFVCELISEILYLPQEDDEPTPEVNTFEVAQLKVKLNCLKETQDSHIKERDFLKANELNTEILNLEESIKNLLDVPQAKEDLKLPEKNEDILVLIKCLDLCNALLSSPKINKLNSILNTLKENVIQDLMLHENEDVRCKAMKCYGLCCIIDHTSAVVGIHLFNTPIDAYNAGAPVAIQTLLVAIGTVVDLIHLFGPDLVAVPQTVGEGLSQSFNEQQEAVFKGGTCLTSIIQGLVDLMEDENPEIQELAGRGLCTLILSGRVRSPLVVSRLILKWASPATNDESTQKLRQIIGYSLELMPSKQEFVHQVEKAMLQTIKTIVKAPKNSPLADINVDTVAKCILSLCKAADDGEYIHSHIGIEICKKMKERPNNKCNLVYSKILLMLTLAEDKSMLQELLQLCDDIRDVVHAKTIVNNIIKFNNIVDRLIQNIENGQAPQQEQDL